MSTETAEKQRVEKLLLQSVHDHGSVKDTFDFATTHNLSHDLVVGVMKSLWTEAYVAIDEISTSFYVLKDEALGFLKNGSPEVQLFNAIPVDGGIDRQALQTVVGDATLKVGQGVCMKNKWIRLDKADGKMYRNVRLICLLLCVNYL